MALVAFSSPQRGALDNELHQFERIATSLSSRFAALALEDLDEAVAASLEDIRVLSASNSARSPSWADRRVPWSSRGGGRGGWQSCDRPAIGAGHEAGGHIVGGHARRTSVNRRASVLRARSREPRAAQRMDAAAHQSAAADRRDPGGALHRRRRERSLARWPRSSSDRPHSSRLTNRYCKRESRLPRRGRNRRPRPGAAGSRSRLTQVASMNSTVLLLGETGTGKELFARAVHAYSRRQHNPRERQLRRAPADTHRKRALRSRARCIHRRVGRSPGPFRTGTPRDDLPRRNRRPTAGASGETAASHSGGEFERVGLIAHRERSTSASSLRRIGTSNRVAKGVSRRSVLSPQRVSHQFPPPFASIPKTFPSSYGSSSIDISAIGRRSRKCRAVMQRCSTRVAGQRPRARNVIERAMIRSSGDAMDYSTTLAGTAMRRRHGRRRLSRSSSAPHRRILRECGWRINGTGNAADGSASTRTRSGSGCRSWASSLPGRAALGGRAARTA